MDGMVRKNVAIIPARGGSKRILKKNIVDLEKKPMVAWTIEAALSANIFDRVLVSTDDKEIASVAQAFGCEVPFLRDKCIDDYCPVSEAVLYALEQLEKDLNEKNDTVFQLMPNCPLRTSRHILYAYENFSCKKMFFQISCFKFGWMNPWWAFKLKKNGKADMLFSQMHGIRSQDLEELYCPTGAVWIASVEKLKQTKSFYTDSTVFFPMDWKAAVDIDNIDDLEAAKALFAMQRESSIK